MELINFLKKIEANLAISLHTAREEIRRKISPFAPDNIENLLKTVRKIFRIKLNAK